MATATLIPVEEYLRNSWSPDREYVDGVILERNLGELPHSFLQTVFWSLFRARGLHAFVELRTQVRPRRFRIPDVMAVRDFPRTRFIRTPPYIVVEILSPEDRIGALTQKIDDYLDFGVPNVWVADPVRKTISSHTHEGSHVFTGAAVTSDGEISIPLDEIFSQMPEAMPDSESE
jgi:Uma2 family endonuclease